MYTATAKAMAMRTTRAMAAREPLPPPRTRTCSSGRVRTARECRPIRSSAENSCMRAARTNDSSKTSERYSSSPPAEFSGGPSGGSERPVMTSLPIPTPFGSVRNGLLRPSGVRQREAPLGARGHILRVGRLRLT
ncbi:hypothetical protein SCALM49S_00055 [Streptomyces californicus]